MSLRRALSHPLLEAAAALAACGVFAYLATAKLLRPENLSQDALVHQYWMWQWLDPALFTDSLTVAVRESARYPDGYEALFYLGTRLVDDPIAFGEWVGLVLMALSGWLVFLIVRAHGAWRPGAWFAALAFLALMDIHRFHGGFPRAFVHPVVLLTVLLALRRHHLAAALVAAGGGLLYPSAAVLAVGVLCVSALRWASGRPGVDVRRGAHAVLAAVLGAASVLVPAQLAGGSPRVFTGAEARRIPEFGKDGPLSFFVPDTLDYLSQNRSGFDLALSGSLLLCFAVGLLLVRPRNARLIRLEVWALPVVALAGFALAHLVLFRLYLPHRYTYPLIAFFAIVVGITLRPTWAALWERRGRWARAFAVLCLPLALAAVAAHLFPLGPRRPLEDLLGDETLLAAGITVAAAAVLAALLRWAPRGSGPVLGALLTGVTVVGALLILPDHKARGSTCKERPVTRFLASLPKDAVIAGDPVDLKCLPATARRSVVISTQLAPAYEVEYFDQGRRRMVDTLQAVYGPSPGAILELAERWGATHLWIRRGLVRAEMGPGGFRWPRRALPYGRMVQRLVSSGEPASLSLPPRCLRFNLEDDRVYSIACLARSAGRT